jgi:gliding motility-associated-like protein
MRQPLFRFLFVTAVLFAVSIPSKAQLVINEYCASNTTGSDVDNFSEFEDWVEIYNAGATSVSLAGYHMSDKASNPTKWVFPASTPSIAAGGFVKVICSGRDVLFSGWLHTNFKLTQCKPEEIVLADAGGNILDSLTMRLNQADHSWGRTTNGANTWSIFTTVTFGTSNNSGTPMLPYATTPIFSLAPGFYSGTQSLSISSPDANVSFRYTINGSEPTVSSTLYSGPISIATTQVIRARAFSTNPSIPASFVESNSYFIGVTHQVAVVSVYGDDISTLLGGTQIEPVSSMEYFDENGVFQTEVTGTSNEHGNDSWAYNQRGFDFESVDQFGYGYCLDYKIFHRKPRTKFQRVILKAAANDNYPFENGAHVRDYYCHDLSQQGRLNVDERSGEFCVVYVNGQYWGLYDIREKVDDADFLDYYFNQDEPNIQMLKTWGATWSEYGGPQAQADWNTLRTFIATQNMTNAANWAYVDSLYNWKSLVDYIILNSVCVTSDWLNWNTIWWRGLDPTGDKKRWRYALWDNDATFGHYINYTGIPDTSPNADPCDPESLPDPGGQGHITILNALMANPTFKQYYINRFADLMNTSLSCDTMLALLDTMHNQITPEMPAQINRWGGSMATWQGNVTTMENFITARCVALQQGMIDCYNLTGPYNIVIDVFPAGAGTVEINSIFLDAFPWSGIYYGGIDIILQAAPTSAIYTFDHWEILDVPNPSGTSDSIGVNLTQNQTIVAVFKEEQVILNAFIPTAFSPNNDGNNDVFHLHGLEGAKIELIVFNRWGQEVFKTTDPSAGWDGTTNGKQNPSGVYAYMLKVENPDGTIDTKSGNITMMR